MARALDHGGSERQLAETAMSLDRNRFDVEVGAFDIDGIRAKDLLKSGIPVTRFPVSSFRSPSAVREAFRLAAYVRRRGIRLVHTFDPPTSAFALPPVKFLTRAVALGSQRGHLDLMPEPVRGMSIFGERLAHGVVVNCEYMRKHLVEDAGFRPERIHLCYNGLDLERFQTGPRARPAAIPEDALVIGTVSVLRPEKGLPTLIDAFSRIRPEFPCAKLLIVGGGPLLEDLRKQAATLGVAPDCIFQPSTADVAPWLRNMDIFVLPSLSEAFSNALMEAMGCGCCPVASRVGGTPELVNDGVTGLLFEPGDAAGLAAAIRRVAVSAELRARLAAAGHDFIHGRFSRETAARRMGEIYSGFLHNSGQQ